jgi:hypothetical protein
MYRTVGVSDKAELERLMVDVVRMLRDAHMPETLRAFDERVLSRPADTLFEPVSDGVDTRCFKPMVELLLRELSALSTDARQPIADRHARAIEALDLAGF